MCCTFSRFKPHRNAVGSDETGIEVSADLSQIKENKERKVDQNWRNLP